MKMQEMNWIFPDWLLWGRLITTALSVAYVTYDLLTNTPEMKVMKWGWILVTLYIGPVAFLLYWITCRGGRNRYDGGQMAGCRH